MRVGLQARIYDPLWLLARQWQLGEFQGEDGGSPAQAQWIGETARITRYLSGPLPAVMPVEGQKFDCHSIPLETLVECEPVQKGAGNLENLRFAVEAGQHFLRCLDQQRTFRNYRQDFKNKYLFTPLSTDERTLLDEESLSFVDLITLRTPDGRKIYAELKPLLRPPPPAKPGLPADLDIDDGDRAEVIAAVESWLQWYEMLITEPSTANASWSDERMEYSFSIAARMEAGEKVLTAREYFSGHTDWHDFNTTEGASIDANRDGPSITITSTTIPAPISYRGMPAARFWEFEDAQVDFGSIKAGPEDLARMLLVEFAISYGNDWFVIPVELAVGSLCRTKSLVITNTFGERFVIPLPNEVKDSLKGWRMFQISAIAPAGKAPTVKDSNLFLLPPALQGSLESTPLEEVLFVRDEMANMAWGIERVLTSATEQPLNQFKQQPEVKKHSDGSQARIVYRLATEVPDNWIPLLPVQSSTGLRLKRGQMLKPDGSKEIMPARGRILNPNLPPPRVLALYEEEVPREGIRVTRHYQLGRWQDGSTHLWMGRRKRIGRGEGSSGLRFDSIDPITP
jgi:hypothetical protein